MQWSHEAKDEVFEKIELPEIGSLITPDKCMSIACSIALQGAGFVGLNPMVGAVAVDSKQRFLGAAAHKKYGKNHAEANLIQEIEGRNQQQYLQGATIYCTLEPCSFFGKTPSCSVLLSKLGLNKVIFGKKDPNPKVNGKGVEILESAGIPCKQDPKFEKLSGELIEIFSFNQKNHLPFVGLKIASSLNGVVGLKSGKVLSITGARAIRYAHWLRQVYDAIIVGADTIICDNPSLDMRNPAIRPSSNPHRFVLDPECRALFSRPWAKHKIGQIENAKLTWVVKQGEKRKIESKRNLNKILDSIEVWEILGNDRQSNLNRLLHKMHGIGISSLLLEGGRKVWASFLELQKVNRLHLFQSGDILNSSQSIYWGDFLDGIAGVSIKNPTITPLQEDWVIESEVCYGGDRNGASTSKI